MWRSILFLLCISSSWASAQGIQFFKGNLAQLFAKAQAEQKHVYVDVYTTWCGPCRMMARQVFPDSAVGAYMNPRFISYKIDAEKGEGPAFAKKYGVTGYPTGLYFNPKGELVFTNSGYNDTEGWFQRMGETALKESADPDNLVALDKSYAQGRRDTAFLRKYLLKRINFDMADDRSADAAEAYLKALPQAVASGMPHLTILVKANAAGNEAVFRHTFKHLADLVKASTSKDTLDLETAIYQAASAVLKRKAQIGAAAFEAEVPIFLQAAQPFKPEAPRELAQLELAARLEAAPALEGNDDILNPKVPQLVGKYFMGLTERQLQTQDSITYLSVKDQVEEAILSMKLSEADAGRMRAANRNLGRASLAARLNSFAWTYYELKRPAPELKQALAWVDESLRIVPTDHNALDTKAHLLAALGRLPEAIAVQRKAIAQARKAEADTQELEAYLAKLQKSATAKAGKGPKARK